MQLTAALLIVQIYPCSEDLKTSEVAFLNSLREMSVNHKLTKHFVNLIKIADSLGSLNNRCCFLALSNKCAQSRSVSGVIYKTVKNLEIKFPELV